MKTLTMKLPEKLSSWLERESKRRGRSKSALVREILESHQEQAPASSLDRVADLCGCASSGLGDLSHNRKRLRGFGK